MMNHEKLAKILEGARSDMESRGMIVLPPLTQEQKIQKTIEIIEKIERNRRRDDDGRSNQNKGSLSKSMDNFYQGGNRKD